MHAGGVIPDRRGPYGRVSIYQTPNRRILFVIDVGWLEGIYMHLIVVMTAYFVRICCVMIMRPEVPGTDRYPVGLRRTRAL